MYNLKKNSPIEWQRTLIHNILENYKEYINYYENRDEI